MNPILCGADPEVAIRVNNHIVPCCGVIDGSKSAPLKVEASAVGLALQEDNVSLEFNINPHLITSFATAIAVAMQELDAQIKGYFGKAAAAYVAESWAFEEKQLLHPNAQAFGCDPDFLAHARGAERQPVDPKKAATTRFFAGHLHVGYDVATCQIPPWAIVQGMELGGYLNIIRNGLDYQPGRRKFYGLSGLFRPKPYGLEYRTPSNFWLSRPKYATDILASAQVIIDRPKAFRALYDVVDWAAVEQFVNAEGDIRGGDMHSRLFAEQWEEFAASPKEN